VFFQFINFLDTLCFGYQREKVWILIFFFFRNLVIPKNMLNGPIFLIGVHGSEGFISTIS
jgi:hypothetical protein